MNFLNGMMAETVVPLIGQVFNVDMNWLGDLVGKLVGAFSLVGVGVIVFSLILKLIVLPFDIFQRVSMSKQNLKMKEQQEKLEKLQKQYANDKEMYNKKMMELYKANGISMFSSCLPMILSIVIFMVAINAFNAYSSYANLTNYNKMVLAYDRAYYERVADLTEENVSFEQEGTISYIVVKDADADYNGKFVYYKVLNRADDPATTEVETPFTAYTDAGFVEYVQSAEVYNYYFDFEVLKADTSEGGWKARADELLALVDEEGQPVYEGEQAVYLKLFKEIGQRAVLDAYNEDLGDDASFLWIKNIWETDAAHEHPVSTWKTLKNSLGNNKLNINGKKVSISKANQYGETNAYNSESYAEVTRMLTKAKSTPNGFYVLIALSIGTILLQQFVTMKMSKEQQKYSSVDGQGVMNQKTMMIMMTLMFAFFSFQYSSAFAIYMITSNLFSLLNTIVINKVVAVSLKKKEEKALQEKYNQRFPGRKLEKDEKKKK